MNNVRVSVLFLPGAAAVRGFSCCFCFVLLSLYSEVYLNVGCR